MTTSGCPHCGDNLVPGKLYCANCGLALGPPDQKVVLDAYITSKVAREVGLATQDEKLVVRKLSNDAEDEVWKRMKRYTWIAGIAVALATAYGFKSINDAKRAIIDEARSRVEPVISQVEFRAQAAQSRVGDVEKRLPAVTDSLNHTSQLADQQRSRIEGQSSEIAAKLDRYQSAKDRADKSSAAFETKANASQQRLDELTKRYDNQLSQISRSTAHESVLEAYPNLDQEPFIMLGPIRTDKTVKKTGEKWVTVYLTGNAVAKSVISKAKLEQMLVDLREQGYNPIVGMISFGGRMGGILERAAAGPYTESGIFYFHTEFKPEAVQIETIVSKYVKLPASSPKLSLPSPIDSYSRNRLEYLIKDGKLDAQIFISSEE